MFMGKKVNEDVVLLPAQRVLVAGYVDGEYMGVVECDVEYPHYGRWGSAFIAGRYRQVVQRHPSADPYFDWVLDTHDYEGIQPLTRNG
jgi:hypothetical protein